MAQLAELPGGFRAAAFPVTRRQLPQGGDGVKRRPVQPPGELLVTEHEHGHLRWKWPLLKGVIRSPNTISEDGLIQALHPYRLLLAGHQEFTPRPDDFAETSRPHYIPALEKELLPICPLIPSGGNHPDRFIHVKRLGQDIIGPNIQSLRPKLFVRKPGCHNEKRRVRQDLDLCQQLLPSARNLLIAQNDGEPDAP